MVIMYCVKDKDKEGNFYYNDIYPSKLQVRMCISGDIDIYIVSVVEANIDDNTPYWGWIDNTGMISMIFRDFVLLQVCFPYGIDAAEKAGQGKRTKVSIVEIGKVDKSKGE